MSSNFRDALLSASSEASTGPIPIILGSTPTTALLTILAMGVNWCAETADELAMIKVAEPSFRPEELPVVTNRLKQSRF